MTDGTNDAASPDLSQVRFPATPDERIVIFTAVLIGAGVIVVSLVQLTALAADGGQKLAGLLDGSRALRGLLFTMIGLFVLAALGAAAYGRTRAGTVLTLGEDGITFRRPAVPVLGLGGQSLHAAWSAIDGVRVGRVRRGLGMSAEFEIRSGRDEVRVNLDRAVDVRGNSLAPSRDADLRTHALPTEIARRAGVAVEAR